MYELGVSKELRLTPGGLRGGGAVAAYRSGMQIQQLQWQMRHQQQSTLESYLQEVAASTALAAMSGPVRDRLRALAAIFDLWAA